MAEFFFRQSEIENPKSKIGGVSCNRSHTCVCEWWPRRSSRQRYLRLAGSQPVPLQSAARRELFRREFRELGYVEGKNIAFEYRYAEDKLDRLPALADELVRLKVDVLVTPATPAALAAKNATRTIPIVFFSVADPVAAGLVDSLARPGGNITGFTNIAAVLAGKRLELLKETVPKLSRVAVLWNPQNPGSAQQWKESQLRGTRTGSATSFHGGKQRRQISRARSKRQLRRVAPLSP